MRLIEAGDFIALRLCDRFAATSRAVRHAARGTATFQTRRTALRVVRICLQNTMMKQEKTDFWQGETCEYCDGTIVEKRVTLHRKVHAKYVLIENVPAGVCTHCGARYFAANVLKTVEASLRGRRAAERQVLVPVYSL